jgi:hypothetical protein
MRIPSAIVFDIVVSKIFIGMDQIQKLGAQSWMIIRGLQERLTRSVGVSLEALDQSFGSVELSDDVRPTEFVSDVVMPDDFAIC